MGDDSDESEMSDVEVDEDDRRFYESKRRRSNDGADKKKKPLQPGYLVKPDRHVVGADARRAASRMIQKNRGLVRKHKGANPRLQLREQFEKKEKKRKDMMGPQYDANRKQSAGFASGISKVAIRSQKLK